MFLFQINLNPAQKAAALKNVSLNNGQDDESSGLPKQDPDAYGGTKISTKTPAPNEAFSKLISGAGDSLEQSYIANQLSKNPEALAYASKGCTFEISSTNADVFSTLDEMDNALSEWINGINSLPSKSDEEMDLIAACTAFSTVNPNGALAALRNILNDLETPEGKAAAASQISFVIDEAQELAKRLAKTDPTFAKKFAAIVNQFTQISCNICDGKSENINVNLESQHTSNPPTIFISCDVKDTNGNKIGKILIPADERENHSIEECTDATNDINSRIKSGQTIATQTVSNVKRTHDEHQREEAAEKHRQEGILNNRGQYVNLTYKIKDASTVARITLNKETRTNELNKITTLESQRNGLAQA